MYAAVSQGDGMCAVVYQENGKYAGMVRGMVYTVCMLVCVRGMVCVLIYVC